MNAMVGFYFFSGNTHSILHNHTKTTIFSHQSYILVTCLQMLQRVVMLAAESLMVLEHQLMDGDQIQDVRVGIKHLKSSQLLTTPLSFYTFSMKCTHLCLCRWSCALLWMSTTC